MLQQKLESAAVSLDPSVQRHAFHLECFGIHEGRWLEQSAVDYGGGGGSWCQLVLRRGLIWLRAEEKIRKEERPET